MALVAAQQRRGRGATGAARVYASDTQHHSPQHARAHHSHDHHENYAATRLQAMHRGNSARSLGINPHRGEDRTQAKKQSSSKPAGERAVAMIGTGKWPA